MVLAPRDFIRAASSAHWVESTRGSAGSSWYATPVHVVSSCTNVDKGELRAFDEELIAFAGKELGPLDRKRRNSVGQCSEAGNGADNGGETHRRRKHC
jgi:hypothetical protein